MRAIPQAIRFLIITAMTVLLVGASNVTAEQPAEILDANATIPSSTRCLAEAIYHEAKNQSKRGKIAVGLVVVNRTANKQYPNTVCGVVYQSTRRGSCQFSWACTQSASINERSRDWRESVELAQILLTNSGKYRNIAPGALYFHSTDVSPSWSRQLKHVTTIEKHRFYRI